MVNLSLTSLKIFLETDETNPNRMLPQLGKIN